MRAYQLEAHMRSAAAFRRRDEDRALRRPENRLGDATQDDTIDELASMTAEHQQVGMLRDSKIAHETGGLACSSADRRRSIHGDTWTTWTATFRAAHDTASCADRVAAALKSVPMTIEANGLVARGAAASTGNSQACLQRRSPLSHARSNIA